MVGVTRSNVFCLCLRDGATKEGHLVSWSPKVTKKIPRDVQIIQQFHAGIVLSPIQGLWM